MDPNFEQPDARPSTARIVALRWAAIRVVEKTTSLPRAFPLDGEPGVSA